MSEKVLCRKCGSEPWITKICGDNGSNANGTMYQMACQSCNNKTKEYKSRFITVGVWESENQKEKP